MIGVPAELSDTIDSTFGAAAPLVTLGLVVAANNARRAAEQRAAAAAADAASAAAKAAVEDTQRAVEEISAQQWGKLLLCLLIDIGGDSSFLLPGLGEATDAIYAPLEALSLNALYGSGVVRARASAGRGAGACRSAWRRLIVRG